jgi:hypothetical protein
MSFVDPSDGGEIVKGRTFVSHQADVFKRFPERFKLVAGGGRLGGITRIDQTVQIGKPRPRPRTPKRPAKPYWLLSDPESQPWRL